MFSDTLGGGGADHCTSLTSSIIISKWSGSSEELMLEDLIRLYLGTKKLCVEQSLCTANIDKSLQGRDM